VFILFFFAQKVKLQVLEFEFYQVILWVRTTEKLSVNWQNFVQVELQLKFAFRIRS